MTTTYKGYNIQITVAVCYSGPGILITEEMTAQDIERLRGHRGSRQLH